MRHAILLRSVARLLNEGESLVDAAYMWRRHPYMLWYGGLAFVALVAIAASVGWQEWPSRLGFGAGAAAIAIYSTTEYRVLARTPGRLILCKASRIRQVARSITEDYPTRTPLTMVDGNMLATTWAFEGLTYTVPKSSERSMRVIAAI
ncbi:MAG: hypothetical protein JJE47_11940 [Acidimicrobiia bacterium]|nr:hypothetical protein [Acidimicrobiia bacterium]